MGLDHLAIPEPKFMKQQRKNQGTFQRKLGPTDQQLVVQGWLKGITQPRIQTQNNISCDQVTTRKKKS